MLKCAGETPMYVASEVQEPRRNRIKRGSLAVVSEAFFDFVFSTTRASAAINQKLLGIVSVLTATILAAACSNQPMTATRFQAQDRATRDDVNLSIEEFKRIDPSIESLFGSAYGYAVFPRVRKGGAGIGGAQGEGRVFEGGAMIGATTITKVSLGLQLGGQVFREIIFFRDRPTLERFKTGEFALSAEATGVAATEGRAATADYDNNVAVFVMPIKGLMFEAAVGGQQFVYAPW